MPRPQITGTYPPFENICPERGYVNVDICMCVSVCVCVVYASRRLGLPGNVELLFRLVLVNVYICLTTKATSCNKREALDLTVINFFLVFPSSMNG